MLQSTAEVLSFKSASRKDQLLRKGHSAPTPTAGHPPDHSERTPRSWCVPELRLLENGREDRTPVRAVRRPPSGELGTVCQFLLSPTLAAATMDTGRLTICTVGWPIQQGRIVHTSRSRLGWCAR